MIAIKRVGPGQNHASKILADFACVAAREGLQGEELGVSMVSQEARLQTPVPHVYLPVLMSLWF